jgi:hypothetical protein
MVCNMQQVVARRHRRLATLARADAAASAALGVLLRTVVKALMGLARAVVERPAGLPLHMCRVAAAVVPS